MEHPDADADVVLVGRYRLQELLGEGAMGSVWRAHDTTLGRTVAVKQVRLAGLPDVQAEAICQRTLREAQIAASLRHRNVVTVHDVVTVRNEATGRDEPWLILEYVPSRTLASVLDDDGPLVPRAAAAVGEQIAAALTAAHAGGVVHRDVKPGNVLVTPGRPGHPPDVKLTDFGIAHAPGAADITATGVVSGTPAYMAPETVKTGGTDTRTDIYSLGATLYEAVEGHSPFGRSHNHVHELLYRIATQPVPPPSRSGPLVGLLGRMLAADPSHRPTASEVESELHRVATAPYEADRTTATAIEELTLLDGAQVGPPARRHRRVWRLAGALTGAVLVLAAAITGVVLNRNVGDSPAPATSQTADLPDLGTVVIDDPRIADPCALVDASVLTPFGQPEVDPYHGPFTSCHVDVGTGLAVELELLEPLASGGLGNLEQLGTVTLARMTPDSTGTTNTCSRVLVLTDRNLVWITATDLTEVTTTDLCAVAEAAVRGTVHRLAGPFTGDRAPLDASSQLAKIDACTLLSPADLATLPELGAPAPDPELAGWRCSWGDVTRPGVDSVQITYHHQGPFTYLDGVPISVGGREAYRDVQDDRCVVAIPQRWFVTDGQERQETVHLTVSGPLRNLCVRATALAEAIAAQLPPPE